MMDQDYIRIDLIFFIEVDLGLGVQLGSVDRRIDVLREVYICLGYGKVINNVILQLTLWNL